jgi:hypothetical protein
MRTQLRPALRPTWDLFIEMDIRLEGLGDRIHHQFEQVRPTLPTLGIRERHS